jgi:hypothetical protein
MASDHPKLLIVEGKDDQYSVVSLMKAHLPWPDDAHPIHLEDGNGVNEILKDGYLTVHLKSRTTMVLGIMLDADKKPKDRYKALRNICLPYFPSMPRSIPATGLITKDNGKQLGIWIMPDNISPGILETFLSFLIPTKHTVVWQQAVNAVATARASGAPCRDVHLPKAELYTWLAWQDPPSLSAGQALTKKVLDPRATSAAAFVAWIRQLYSI